jgi:hypothetical protein
MKTPILLGLLLPAALVATVALADDKATCVDAASRGQRLRDTHKLIEAREQLRVCAAAACPPVVQSDCAGWLADVERALPSVVVTAKDGAGGDLADVKVSADGQPLLSRLDGQALPMNPGSYTLHFERADGTSLDRVVIVREGEKNQAVAVVLGAPALASPATPSAASTTLPPTPGVESPARPGAAATRRTLGWVLGGVGVVGLGVGAALGFSAIGDKNSADCSASNQCLAGPLSSAKSAALGADVGLIAGGVLLAGGAALVLFGSSGAHERTAASLKMAPAIGAGSGGIVLAGRW